jgi:hypothetical protein
MIYALDKTINWSREWNDNFEVHLFHVQCSRIELWLCRLEWIKMNNFAKTNHTLKVLCYILETKLRA